MGYLNNISHGSVGLWQINPPDPENIWDTRIVLGRPIMIVNRLQNTQFCEMIKMLHYSITYDPSAAMTSWACSWSLNSCLESSSSVTWSIARCTALNLLNRCPVVRRNSIIVLELALVPGARTEMDTRFGKQVKVMKSIVFLENLDSHHAAATRVTMQ